MCFACGILCNMYRYGTASEISVIYVFSITIQFKCFFRNCPSNFSNVPLNFDEWDRMSPLYPDLDRSPIQFCKISLQILSQIIRSL